MIVFSNPGELDLQLLSTIGTSIKPNSANPIGYFGTGLKYALATLLREGCSINIQIGTNTYSVETKPTTIRGKSFNLICLIGRCDSVQLPFTTDLGKNWQPWMAYRELWANALDEGGNTTAIKGTCKNCFPPRDCNGMCKRYHENISSPSPQPNTTSILVSGAAIEEAHDLRDHFILNNTTKTLLDSTSSLEVYDGTSDCIFYRGMKVCQASTLFTYNILSPLELTEDRTVSEWECRWQIGTYIAESCTNLTVLHETLTAPPDYLESNIYYHFHTPSQDFSSARDKILSSLDRPKLNKSLLPHETPTCCPTCGRPY